MTVCEANNHLSDVYFAEEIIILIVPFFELVIGRIKPEIVAPGYTVLTAYGNHTGKPRDDDTSRTSGTR